MGKLKIKHGRLTYRYILTTVDVFSRYVWLRPLQSKRSSEIAKHLQEIYCEHGPPKMVQHDQGKEFRGEVQRLFKSLAIKDIQSSAYHPQSQGKVERTHRVLRKKIMYDLLNIQRGGVNWVEHLKVYARIMNEDPKEVLHWLSPFQVYYGRRSNRVTNPISNPPTHFEYTEDILPSQRHRQLFEDRRCKLRKRAKKATERCNERMIRAKHVAPSVYRVHDKVLVRVKMSNHRLAVSKRHVVLPGVIIKCNIRLSRYKVKFQKPPRSTPVQQWFSVSDITSVTRSQERFRKSLARHYQVYTHQDRLQEFESSGLHIRLDPDPDGSCQFSAMADQLSTIGIFRSATTLREEIVTNLRNFPIAVDGTPLLQYVEGTWTDYIHSMAQPETFGDHITLQRAALMFNVQFLVVSTLGVDATSIISPSGNFCEGLPVLAIGHFAEGHGEHYVSLDGPTDPYIQALQEAENERVLHINNSSASLSIDIDPGCSPGSGIEAVPVSEPEEENLEAVPVSELEEENLEADPVSELEEENLEVDPVLRENIPYLPVEILKEIIKLTLDMDVTMFGTFNRVSSLFREVSKPYLPTIYIRDSVAQTLGLDNKGDFCISIMKIYKSCGRSSGLALRIKDLFGQNPRWMRAWVVLRHIAFGHYKVIHIFWKK